MPIDFDASSGGKSLKFEKVALHEAGQGLKATVVFSDKRDKVKWVNDKPVPDLWDDGNPKDEYVYDLAIEAGLISFVKRDEDGDAVLDAAGDPVFESRKVAEIDGCMVTSSWWLMKACKDARLNDGDVFTVKRISPAGAKKVECELEVIGHVDKPKHYSEPKGGGIDFGEPAAPAQPAVDTDSPF